MQRSYLAAILTVLMVVAMTGLAFGQKTFGPGPTPDPVNPMPGLSGETGLWKVISAETPPKHSWGSVGWIDRINRNPGQLTITQTGTSLFFSPTSRLELALRININTHILSRREDELGLGQATLNALHYSTGCVGCPLLGPPVLQNPAFLMPQLRTPTNVLTGRTGYYPLFPFVNRRFQTGVGDVIISGKYNFLSEARGDKLSVAISPYFSIPTHHTYQDLLNTGSQYGTTYGGVDLLLSKRVSVAGLYANVGYEYLPTDSHAVGALVGNTHALPVRIGMNVPRTGKLQLIWEVTADNFVNQGLPNSTFGSPDAIDETVGLRWYLRPWIAANGGYRRTINQTGGDKTGFTFSLSTANLPVAPVRITPPPVVTCSADPTRAQIGTPIRLTATGTTTSGRTLTYAWSSPAGHVEGMGPAARVDTTTLAPGDYSATVRVTDGVDGFADCSTSFSVLAPPPPPPMNPPTASCSVDRGSVTRGEAVTFTVNGASRDGRQLTYAWSGAVRGTGRTARLDTTNLNAGNYTGNAKVTDDRGLSADCSASATVREVVVPPAPMMREINSCTFPNKLKPTRVDNTCKGALDDVAQAAKNDPDATIILTGSADPKEMKKAPKGKMAVDLGAQRAVNAKDYLVTEKGIAASRISIRSANSGTADLHSFLVPNRASYTGAGAAVSEPKAQPRSGKKPMGMKKSAAMSTDAAPMEKPMKKKSAMKKAEAATADDGKDVAKDTKKAAKATEHGVEKAAKATEKGTKKVVKKMEGKDDKKMDDKK